MAIAAVQPFALLKKYINIHQNELHISGESIDIDSMGRLLVFSAGKAASAMAKEAENILGDLITDGICITKYNHSLKLKKLKTIEAAHPVPDENSVLAGTKVLESVNHLSPDDIVLLLLSGGASSLMADIPEGCTLEETQKLFRELVNCGATIQEINCIRKHLSRIKGGQLVMAVHPARIFTLIISDVPGDELSVIASGPTVPDPTTFNDAFNILVQYELWPGLSDNIKNYIIKGLNKLITETPGPGNSVFDSAFTTIVGNLKIALTAAKEKAEVLGFETYIINDSLSGNTDIEARKLVQFVLNFKSNVPFCILMGGETTLKVTGHGKGGRNQHFALCALDELENHVAGNIDYFTILSAGTDGTDGPTDVAGAYIDSGLHSKELNNKIEIEKHLLNFDAYHFFEKSGGLFKTGPTQTNVMDIVIALILKR